MGLVWKPIPLNEIRASSVEDGTRTLEYRRSLMLAPARPAEPEGATSAAEQPSAIVDAVQITGTPGFTDAEVAGPLELDAGNRFDVRADRGSPPLGQLYLDHGYHRVGVVPTRSEDAGRTHVSLTYDIERGPGP